MTVRTVEDIARQIERAARNERWLESPRPGQAFGFWPEYVNDYGPDAWKERLADRKVLTPKQISDFDEVVDWLANIKGDTARIIWAYAKRVGWRKIAFMVGKDPKTCRYWRKNALAHIHARISKVNYKKCSYT